MIKCPVKQLSMYRSYNHIIRHLNLNHCRNYFTIQVSWLSACWCPIACSWCPFYFCAPAPLTSWVHHWQGDDTAHNIHLFSQLSKSVFHIFWDQFKTFTSSHTWSPNLTVTTYEHNMMIKIWMPFIQTLLKYHVTVPSPVIGWALKPDPYASAPPGEEAEWCCW